MTAMEMLIVLYRVKVLYFIKHCAVTQTLINLIYSMFNVYWFRRYMLLCKRDAPQTPAIDCVCLYKEGPELILYYMDMYVSSTF